jgi:hypothetical protein
MVIGAPADLIAAEGTSTQPPQSKQRQDDSHLRLAPQFSTSGRID